MSRTPISPEIESLFFEALQIPWSRRGDWIASATVGRESLAKDVLTLLQAHEASEVSSRDRLVGSWRLLELLGRGGMGEVWLASRTGAEFDQRAAVKFVRSGLGADVLLPRFEQERRLLARLEHANIARLIDGGVAPDGRPFLAMEYVEGEPIFDFCDHHRLDVRARVDLVRQLCGAVAHAHRNLIVHLDIKPGNVLVTADGSPKLLDFGVAKLLEADNGSRSTLPLATPRYASPEQLRGDPVTTASDVYSLGVLLFELLTGSLPYSISGDSVAEVIGAITTQDPRRASEIKRAGSQPVPRGDLDAILAKALEKDPARRFGSVESFAADLANYLEGLPVQARPQTLIYRTGRFIRRNRVAAASALLVALSLTVGLAAALWEAGIARAERQRAEQRFNDVRQLAHAFLFDFHDAIQNLPGATPARHLVVDKALQYLKSLSQESGTDSGLQRELAEAYLRVGEVQGGLGYPNLGDSDGALRSFERALEISQNAVRRYPQNVQWRRYLARAEMNVGDLKGERAGPAAAVEHYQDALRTLQTIEPLITEDMSAQFELALICEALGDALGNPGLANVGDYEGAKKYYERSLAIHETIAVKQPANLRNRRGIGLEQMKIGDVELGLGNADAALRQYRRAVASLEAVLADNPLDPSTRMFLALAEGSVGQALEAAGDTREAVEHYAKASGMHRELVQADPHNEMSKNSYALSLQKYAGLLSKTGDTAGAAARYQEALAIARELSAADPQNLRRKGLCGEIITALGAIAAQNGASAQATRLYREGLELVRQRADRAGATADDASAYAEQLLTCPLKPLANARQALAYARKALAAGLGSKWVYLDQVARALYATGDLAGAIEQEREGVRLAPPASPKRKELAQRLVKFEAERR